MIIEFNSLQLGNSDYSITRLDGVYDIPIRTSSSELVGNHGGNIFIQKYGMRPISIEGVIKSFDRSQMVTKVQALVTAFQLGSTATLLLSNDYTSATIDCKVVSMPSLYDVPEQVYHKVFRIELLAENPYFSDGVIQTDSTTPLTSSGFPISATLPMPMGVISGGTLNIQNDGTIAGYATLEITGQIVNPSVINTANGQGFTLNYTNTADNVITMQYTTKGLEVIDSNGLSLMEYFSGTFPVIELGANTLRFSASTNTSGELTYYFSNKYLSLAL